MNGYIHLPLEAGKDITEQTVPLMRTEAGQQIIPHLNESIRVKGTIYKVYDILWDHDAGTVHVYVKEGR